MPVIRTQQAIAKLQPGDVLEVLCTDPGVKADMPAWCRVHGHRLIEIVDAPDGIRVRIEVLASS
jgi:tRNA 2-thiouridine synthesizing protein A